MATPLESFSVGEAAAILGVSPATLRGWERRYRVLEPRRTASNHRRYSVTELRLLAALTLTAARPDAPFEAMPDLAVIDQRVWRAIADRLPDLMLILSQDGRTVDANLAAARAVGVNRRWLLNRPFQELADPRDRDRAAEISTPPLRHLPGWTVRLKTGDWYSAFCFDCRPVRYQQERHLVLIGRRSPARPHRSIPVHSEVPRHGSQPVRR